MVVASSRLKYELKKLNVHHNFLVQIKYGIVFFCIVSLIGWYFFQGSLILKTFSTCAVILLALTYFFTYELYARQSLNIQEKQWKSKTNSDDVKDKNEMWNRNRVNKSDRSDEKNLLSKRSTITSPVKLNMNRLNSNTNNDNFDINSALKMGKMTWAEVETIRQQMSDTIHNNHAAHFSNIRSPSAFGSSVRSPLVYNASPIINDITLSETKLSSSRSGYRTVHYSQAIGMKSEIPDEWIDALNSILLKHLRRELHKLETTAATIIKYIAIAAQVGMPGSTFSKDDLIKYHNLLTIKSESEKLENGNVMTLGKVMEQLLAGGFNNELLYEYDSSLSILSTCFLIEGSNAEYFINDGHYDRHSSTRYHLDPNFSSNIQSVSFPNLSNLIELESVSDRTISTSAIMLRCNQLLANSQDGLLRTGRSNGNLTPSPHARYHYPSTHSTDLPTSLSERYDIKPKRHQHRHHDELSEEELIFALFLNKCDSLSHQRFSVKHYFPEFEDLQKLIRKKNPRVVFLKTSTAEEESSPYPASVSRMSMLSPMKDKLSFHSLFEERHQSHHGMLSPTTHQSMISMHHMDIFRLHPYPEWIRMESGRLNHLESMIIFLIVMYQSLQESSSSIESNQSSQEINHGDYYSNSISEMTTVKELLEEILGTRDVRDCLIHTYGFKPF